MLTIEDFKEILAHGHKATDWSKHAKHENHTSRYTVTKLQNCTYNIRKTGGSGTETTVNDYNPGGSNHGQLQDGVFPPASLDQNNYQLYGGGANNTHNYSSLPVVIRSKLIDLMI